MSERPFHVLFLCTGNSARSILAECALNRHGAGRFRAFSAGSQPTGEVNPLSLVVLREQGYDPDRLDLRSKSWDDFARDDAPPLDFVFTVCDSAAGETCPAWPGQPMTAHWGVEDPAAATGSDAERLWVFRRVHRELERRIEIFTSLPIRTLDWLSLQRRLDEIGKGGSKD